MATVPVIFCADATSLWKTAANKSLLCGMGKELPATRCDVYVAARKELGSSGTPSNWSTWWIMDGGDDAEQAPLYV